MAHGQQQIMCSVDSCHYWTSGNKCGANCIMVTADSFAASAPDTIDAPQASALSPTPADYCEESCCKTFTPNGSGKEHLEGVMKT